MTSLRRNEAWRMGPGPRSTGGRATAPRASKRQLLTCRARRTGGNARGSSRARPSEVSGRVEAERGRPRNADAQMCGESGHVSVIRLNGGVVETRNIGGVFEAEREAEQRVVGRRRQTVERVVAQCLEAGALLATCPSPRAAERTRHGERLEDGARRGASGTPVAVLDRPGPTPLAVASAAPSVAGDEHGASSSSGIRLVTLLAVSLEARALAEFPWTVVRFERPALRARRK